MLRHAQDVVSAVRPEVDASDTCIAARQDFDRPRQLTGEERARLKMQRSAANALGPAIARMDDDLGPAVRWNWLRADVLRASLEQPQPFDERRQRGWRTELPVDDRDGQPRGFDCLS
jgi:hypothetical protein